MLREARSKRLNLMDRLGFFSQHASEAARGLTRADAKAPPSLAGANLPQAFRRMQRICTLEP